MWLGIVQGGHIGNGEVGDFLAWEDVAPEGIEHGGDMRIRSWDGGILGLLMCLWGGDDINGGVFLGSSRVRPLWAG